MEGGGGGNAAREPRQLYSDQNQQSNFSEVGNGSISTVSTDSPVVQLSFPPISLGTQPSCLFLFPLLDHLH